jgi:hypothetical protein
MYVSTGEKMWDLLIAIVTISGPILIVLVRQHYRLKNIDTALNQAEIDLVGGENTSEAPSIREKINNLSLQLEKSIDNAVEQLQSDRILDKIENTQQKQLIFNAINDLREDVSNIRSDLDINTKTGIEETKKNRKSLEKTQELLIIHMKAEDDLFNDFLNDKITSDQFVKAFLDIHERNQKKNDE